jgi:uncharacterized membrane protein YebE (DUF533 family)
MKTKNKEQITRKEALKKMGSYAAFTALGTMVLLSPKASQAGSQSPRPPKRESPPSPPKKEDEGILSI